MDYFPKWMRVVHEAIDVMFVGMAPFSIVLIPIWALAATIYIDRYEIPQLINKVKERGGRNV